MPSEDYNRVNLLYEELKTIQGKLDNFEKKILFYDKIVWLCSTLLIIFGGTGAFGFKLIDKVCSDITSLEYRIEQLSDWEVKVSKSFAEVERYKNNAISNIALHTQSLKEGLNTASQSSIKQAESSIDNLTGEKITILKELSTTLGNKMNVTSDNLEKRLIETAKWVNYVTKQELAERLTNIRSKSFVIENSDGKDIIKLYSDKNGGVFDINNKSGENRFKFYLLSDKSMPFLSLYDGNGYNSLTLGIYTNTNNPFLAMSNPETKKNVLNLYSSENGGSFNINSKFGENRFKFYIFDQDIPYLKLYDNSNNDFLTLGIYTDSKEPFLSMKSSETKKETVQLYSDKDGGGFNINSKKIISP